MARLEPVLDRRTFNITMLSGVAALMGRNAMAQATPAMWLLFTKSAGYEHSVIKSDIGQPSHLGRCLKPLFETRNLGLRESKDGSLFEPETIGAFAGFVFFTSGDLTTPGTDQQPPMSAAGKAALLRAVQNGKPFIGLHSAADTFHGPADGPVDPYIAMLGGEFEAHGDQQVAAATIDDPTFPGIGQQNDWTFNEEWYVLKNLASDLKPIQQLKTAGMKGNMYQRDPFPLTWTRTHGQGRLFYTGLAHREETVASEAFLNLIGGAVDWCRG